MARTLYQVWALILVLSLLTAANGQSSTPQKPRTPEAVPHTSWTPTLESDFGVSKDAFRAMGLGNLTVSQMEQLLIWVANRERQAKTSVPVTTFNCGRTGQPFLDQRPEVYDKVRVYVSASGNANEIISGVRERLRAMVGTEVVYTLSEADLSVSLVGVKTTAKGSGYQLGNAISVVTSQPCVWMVGTYPLNYDTVQDQFIEVGSETSAMVADIVSTVDTNSLENQRKSNAGLKKFLQDKKK